MLRALPHVAWFVLPLALLVGVRLGGAWTLLPLAVLLGFLPVADWIAGLNLRNAGHDEADLSGNVWFRAITLWRRQAERRRLVGRSFRRTPMPRTSEEWVAQYAQSHTHPVNRTLHTLGIPMIALSIPLFAVAYFVRGFWPVPVGLFAIGWIFQFVGHGFEGKPPEFFKDPRFLFVGLRWWFAKIRGRA